MIDYYILFHAQTVLFIIIIIPITSINGIQQLCFYCRPSFSFFTLFFPNTPATQCLLLRISALFPHQYVCKHLLYDVFVIKSDILHVVIEAFFYLATTVDFLNALN